MHKRTQRYNFPILHLFNVNGRRDARPVVHRLLGYYSQLKAIETAFTLNQKAPGLIVIAKFAIGLIQK